MARYDDYEKTVMVPSDFSGLEVDHRSPVGRSRHSDKPLPGIPEKAFCPTVARYGEAGHAFPAAGRYPSGLELQEDSAMKEVLVSDEKTEAQRNQAKHPRSKKLKIVACGCTILIIAVIAGVVGGVLGTRRNEKTQEPPASTPIPSPTAPPATVNEQLKSYDVMVDSPIVPVSFVAGSNDTISSRSPGQYVHVFYQNAQGGPQQLKQAPSGDWSSMERPLFTDAANNTGLAAINYLNETTRETSLFYISQDGTIREKRLYPNQTDETWNLGSLSFEHYRVSGHSGFDDDDSKSGWASFRMTAVYSTNFTTGAGARLFYHSKNASSSWIQEAIWVQKNDTWSQGSRLYGALPSTHLAAVIDPPTQALRLLYATSNNTLSESWYNISDSNPSWTAGIDIPDVLTGSSADFAVITTATDTILYYTNATKDTSNITLHELTLPAPTSKTASTSSSSIVTTMALMANNTGGKLHSLYAPIGAVYSTADDDEDASITVFWTEGAEDRQSGYGVMKSLSRGVNAVWVPDKDVKLPIDDGEAT